MPRRPGSFELILPSRAPGTPAFRWLYGAFRDQILAGRLRPGAALPSSRELARQYGLARGTVVGAYEQLAAEGYLESVVGAGTRVARVVPDRLLEVALPAPRPPASAAPDRRPLSKRGELVGPGPPADARPVRAFRPNLPDLTHFPTQLWAQVASRRLKRLTHADLESCEPFGDPVLRKVLADYLRTSRGVVCAPEQLIILSGVQEGLDLAARLLVDPGDEVWVENPGYPDAGRIFAAQGAEVRRVEVDSEGLVVAPSSPAARLVYVTPAHQYPLGITMSIRRRLALLEWAEATGAWIFEDDYDSEFRYSGHPVPALQGLTSGGAVLFSGTFNKVLFPSLRLGYLVVPPALIDTFAAQRALSLRYPPLLEQRVLLDFITQGHFGRHLRRMRQVYGERSAALFESARELLGGALELASVDAGLQTAARFALPLDAEAVASAAAMRGVEVAPLSRFSPTPLPFSGLQLGFAAVDTGEIRRGMEELARAVVAVAAIA